MTGIYFWLRGCAYRGRGLFFVFNYNLLDLDTQPTFQPLIHKMCQMQYRYVGTFMIPEVLVVVMEQKCIDFECIT